MKVDIYLLTRRGRLMGKQVVADDDVIAANEMLKLGSPMEVNEWLATRPEPTHVMTTYGKDPADVVVQVVRQGDISMLFDETTKEWYFATEIANGFLKNRA
jgi:hypothetical protein